MKTLLAAHGLSATALAQFLWTSIQPLARVAPDPGRPPPMPVAVEMSKPDVATCVLAISAQSDPARPANLGKRQANPRLKRILYYLVIAREAGADPRP